MYLLSDNGHANTEVTILSDHIHSNQAESRVGSDHKESELLISPARGKLLSYYLFCLGIITFGICLTAAIGKAVINELRGPSVIGCNHWYLLGGNNS